MYSFEEQATASTVMRDYFSCYTEETTCVFDKSFQQVPLVIALDFRFIELQSLESYMKASRLLFLDVIDTVSSSLQTICESESQEEMKSKSTELAGRMQAVKQDQEQKITAQQRKTPIRTKNEEFLNSYLVDRIAEAAERSGLIVMTNKSATGIKTSLSPSRLETSRPDLLMYSKTSNTGIVIKGVNEEGEENQEGEEGGGEEDGGEEKGGEEEEGEEVDDRRKRREEEVDDRRKRRREEVDDRRKRRRDEEISLFGSVSKNKLTNTEPEAQLLGNMEKLAGDLAYHHLSKGKKGNIGFRYIMIYGLLITYNLDESASYKLTMDFVKNESHLLVEHKRLPIQHNVNRLMWQMQDMNTRESKALIV